MFIAAVLQYLVKEVLMLAGFACQLKGKKIITPAYLQRAFRGDEELNKLTAFT